MKNCSLENKRVDRILLIRLRNIGDVLLIVPALRAFREAFPRAHIAALVNSGTEEMLTGNPLLNEVLVFERRWKELPLPQKTARQMSFLRDIRSRRFDLAVNMTEGDRGAFLCLASGAALKVGLYDPGSGLWWKKRIFDCLVRMPDWKAHMVEQMLEIPRQLGLRPGDNRVEIFCSRKDEERIRELLAAEGVGPRDRLVHIHPTSRWLFKCWRDEGMARVIDSLQKTGNARVVLTAGGDRREMEKIGRILSFCETRPVNLAGRTSLKQLAALSRLSRLFIGVDTAPMHIAAAVGTPVLALFGPSGEFNWGPWGNGHVVIKKEWECRPCGKNTCEGGTNIRCLDEISEEEVLARAFEMLAREE